MYKTYVRANQEFPNAIARGQSLFDALKMTTAKEDIDLLTMELLEISAPSTKKNSISLGTLDEVDLAVSDEEDTETSYEADKEVAVA